MLKIFLITFLLFYQIVFAEINVKSIIVLSNNIPKECGLRFIIKETKNSYNVSISTKKLKNNNTLTRFSVASEIKIQDADIITSALSISEIIDKKNSKKNNFELLNQTNQNSMTFFFQELLIGGGELKINKKSYEIKGPIDSKVRLEYLFCTGEMFLPNYKLNE